MSQALWSKRNSPRRTPFSSAMTVVLPALALAAGAGLGLHSAGVFDSASVFRTADVGLARPMSIVRKSEEVTLSPTIERVIEKGLDLEIETDVPISITIEGYMWNASRDRLSMVLSRFLWMPNSEIYAVQGEKAGLPAKVVRVPGRDELVPVNFRWGNHNLFAARGITLTATHVDDLGLDRAEADSVVFLTAVRHPSEVRLMYLPFPAAK